MEAREVSTSSSEPDLRGVEVRVERHRAVPQADDGGGGLAVATESVRTRRAEMVRGGAARSPRQSPGGTPFPFPGRAIRAYEQCQKIYGPLGMKGPVTFAGAAWTQLQPNQAHKSCRQSNGQKICAPTNPKTHVYCIAFLKKNGDIIVALHASHVQTHELVFFSAPYTPKNY